MNRISEAHRNAGFIRQKATHADRSLNLRVRPDHRGLLPTEVDVPGAKALAPYPQTVGPVAATRAHPCPITPMLHHSTRHFETCECATTIAGACHLPGVWAESMLHDMDPAGRLRNAAQAAKRLREFFSPDRATRIAFVSFLVVSPAYYICRSQHFCMAGHLQHADDGTPLAWLADALWVIGFVCSTILAFRSEVTFHYVFLFALGVAFLGFADPHGLGGILGLPVHVALCLFAVACLLGWIP